MKNKELFDICFRCRENRPERFRHITDKQWERLKALAEGAGECIDWFPPCIKGREFIPDDCPDIDELKLELCFWAFS